MSFEFNPPFPFAGGKKKEIDQAAKQRAELIMVRSEKNERNNFLKKVDFFIGIIDKQLKSIDNKIKADAGLLVGAKMAIRGLIEACDLEISREKNRFSDAEKYNGNLKELRDAFDSIKDSLLATEMQAIGNAGELKPQIKIQEEGGALFKVKQSVNNEITLNKAA